MAFITGAQVHIPMWADRIMLGWLFRCLSSPGTYMPRYLDGLKLIPLLWRHQERLPE